MRLATLSRLVRGQGGPSTMLHAHIDVVDPGDAQKWRFPPFAGARAEGYLWGRGSSDDKGCVAAQVYAAGLLLASGIKPVGDLYVVAAINEENGGVGSRYLAQHLKPDLAIIGEPSANTLRRGHRGRFEFLVSMLGRSVHASVPERGANPHYAMARFMLGLQAMPRYREAVFGGSSITPTLGYVDQTSSNVIPAVATVHLDWRVAPGETLDDAFAKLQNLVDQALAAEPQIKAEIILREHTITTHTGMEMTIRHDLGAFLMAEDDVRLAKAQTLVAEALGHAVETDVWAFCTDGGHLYAAGVPCIGFGPGREEMAHVLDERLSEDELIDAVAAYMALGYGMGGDELTAS